MTQIKNLTPAHLRCGVSISCPSLHQLEDGRLRIVGKIDPTLTVNEDYSPIDQSAWDGIGQDETAIIIESALLDVYVAEKAKSQWQPIDTAPKDGTEILLFWPATGTGTSRASQHPVYAENIIATGHWGQPRFTPSAFEPHWLMGGRWTPGDDPTHWMPLPLPPVSEG